ncbi:MAG: M15 family metallopeptidase [Alphaproteobacteria bacterium]
MKTISFDDLLPLDLAADAFPLRVELAYSRAAPPNIFGKIYQDSAALWLHGDLARIVLLASLILRETHQTYRFVLYDGLRTTEAQALMAEAEIVKANPHWLSPPRLLSPAGAGAHPRAMAIDIGLEDEAAAALIDMGTVFDHLAEDSGPAHNPAHRDYHGLAPLHRQNRIILDTAMQRAAALLKTPLTLLPQEWWDFRLPEEVYGQYAPLADSDLPPCARMVSGGAAIDNPEHYRARFAALKAELQALLTR